MLDRHRVEGALERTVAPTLLKSLLFYCGLFLPAFWASQEQLTKTAYFVRLIIRDEDEAVQSYHIGYKFRRAFAELSTSRQEAIQHHAHTPLRESHANAFRYAATLYDDCGFSEHVVPFLNYDANKVLMNLGFDVIYSPNKSEIGPSVRAALTAARTRRTISFLELGPPVSSQT